MVVKPEECSWDVAWGFSPQSYIVNKCIMHLFCRYRKIEHAEFILVSKRLHRQINVSYTPVRCIMRYPKVGYKIEHTEFNTWSFPPGDEFTYLQPEWVSNEKQTKRIPVVVVVVVVDVSGFLVSCVSYIFPWEYV